MAFPTNPTNGQAATVNNISYIYNGTLGVWESNQIATSANLTVTGNAIVSAATILGSTLSVSGGTTLSSTLAVSGTTVFSSNVRTTGLGVGTAPSSTTGEIRATNAITAFYSDKRLKTEIARIENALDKLDQLTGVIYTQNKLAEQFGYNNYEQQVGLYAQDVNLVQPEAVKPAPFDTNPDGSSISGEHYLTVQYDKLVPLLVEAIKELRLEVNALKDK